jgi:1-acyl-sn-glycerol-3-phosphate acyltransferase
MLYAFAKLLFRIYFALFYRVRTEGLENVPETGPVILCSNHPTGLDMFLIGTRIPRRKVHYMAKAELFRNRFLAFLLRRLAAFPISRGKGDVGSVKTVYRLLKQNQIVGVFPEGTRTKKKDPNRRKAGAALFAHHSKAPILPVAIDRPFRIFGKVRVIFGKPFYLDEPEGHVQGESYTKNELLEGSEIIINRIYGLINQ